jgi:hypothetical protein
MGSTPYRSFGTAGFRKADHLSKSINYRGMRPEGIFEIDEN